jgi:hypothetical protein
VGANSGPHVQRQHIFYGGLEVINTFLRVHPIPGVLDFFDYSEAGVGLIYENGVMTSAGLVSGTPPGGVPIDAQPDAVTGAGAELLDGFESVDGPQGGLSMPQRLLTNNPDPAYRLVYRDGNVTNQNLCAGDDEELYGASGPQLNSAVNNTDEAGRVMWGGGQFSNLFYQRSIYYEAPGQADGSRRLAEMQQPLELSLQGIQLDEAPSGYPRPKGATPLRVSLVPAHDQCLAPNRTHGPPLAFGSCAPPTQTSQDLTVGTPDANKKSTGSTGSVLLRVVSCPACAAPLPTADVRIDASITDVRNRTSLDDYTGELEGRFALRITDRYNAAGAGPQADAATVEDTSFKVALPCAATSGDTGAACAVSTSVSAVLPGSTRDGDRAIWELGAIGLYDASGGLFATQGVFAP